MPTQPPRPSPGRRSAVSRAAAPQSTNWRRPPRNSWFTRFAKGTSRATGRPAAFVAALAIIIVWALTGPVFHFSDTWQLVINTGTTIITFLMVFLIQNTQYRDSEAVHLKLDELIRAQQGAHNALLDLEDLDDKELDRIRETYAELAESARELLRQRGADTGTPDVKPA
ncbi:MAG: low affinity iron permease family protein [Bacteroidota bacterium]